MQAAATSNHTIKAIFAVFFLQSAVLGNWIPRIPDFKAMLGLSDAGLGLCLLAIPFGTMMGLLVAGRIIEKTGLRFACQIFLPLWAIAFVLPPFAESQAVFMFYLFLCGVAVGLIEVGMNTEADRIEQDLNKRIMSRCHGFWSLGSMAGALLGGLFAHAGVSTTVHFIIVMPIIAMLGFWSASLLPRIPIASHHIESDSQDKPLLFRLPSKAILLLCIMPIGAMVVEGAFIDWSAVFVRSVLEASPLAISIIYSFFAIVMASVRLCGDAISDRVPAERIVQVSGIAACIGVVIFSLSPNIYVAMIGAAISGMGVAIVYPLAMTAAARRPGKSADNVASLTMVSFSAFLFAPPLIGFLASAFGLRIALLMLVPLAITTVFLADQVRTDEVSGS